MLSQIGNISANLAQALAEQAAATAAGAGPPTREPNAARNGPDLASRLSGVSAMVADLAGGLNAAATAAGIAGGARQPSAPATVTVDGQPVPGANGLSQRVPPITYDWPVPLILDHSYLVEINKFENC